VACTTPVHCHLRAHVGAVVVVVARSVGRVIKLCSHKTHENNQVSRERVSNRASHINQDDNKWLY
jgi:hypothetical protein